MSVHDLTDVEQLSDEEREILDYIVAQDYASGTSISLRDDDGPAPLSFNQQRIWFIQMLDPRSAAYVIPLAIQISGDLDEAALENSLQEIVRRHESLRTCYIERDGKPRQITDSQPDITLTITDLSGLNAEQSAEQVKQALRDEEKHPFDLTRSPLLRASLLRLSESRRVLIMGLHHIAVDAGSIGILMRELKIFYRAFAAGDEMPLPEMQIQYADYAVWQRNRLDAAEIERLLGYWRRQLDGVQTLQLATDRPRPAVQTHSGGLRSKRFAGGLRERVWQLAMRNQATPFMVLLAALAVMLARQSGQSEVTVGSPIVNRSLPELEPLVGLFVNMLVLRNDVSGDPSFQELLSRVRLTAMDAYAHQDLPFEKLVEALKPVRDESRGPLFQITFVLHDVPVEPNEVEVKNDPVFAKLPRQTASTHFDIEFELFATPQDLVLAVTYNTDLFDESTIERLLSQYQRVLQSVVEEPGIRLSAIDLLGDAERDCLLREWNATSVNIARESSVVSEFVRQVEETPESLAVGYGGEGLTYRQLDEHSNQLAQWLQGRGVQRESLVGVCMERSLELVVGILGILKAGAGYVPLDADYPQERLSYMVSDTGLELVLCRDETVAVMSDLDIEVIDVDARHAEFEQQTTAAPAVDLDGNNVAYVMYTSGSTGWPKGVVVEHRSVIRLVRGANYGDLGPGEVMLQLAPVSFDASTLEFWGSLLNGGELLLYPRGVLSLSELGEFLVGRGVSVLWLTAALFHRMVDEELESLRAVRQVFAGGEALSLNHVRRYLDGLAPGHQLVNGYGPTENTTFTCCYVMDSETELGETVPIGRPVSNTQVYVLDGSGALLPMGSVGELYAGGDGLAREYLHQPEMTAQKFVASPFKAGERLYRTGDLVRWRADGVLEYMGREDRQVKLRGHRIELGEVEHALTSHEGLRDAVVICREDQIDDKRLVGYVVGKPGEDAITASVLRTYLQSRLPAYMVPSAIVHLDELPLTPVGKVDRDALPSPGGERQAEAIFVAPRNKLEQQIAEVWCEVLGVEQVGIDDNFFELGGHSLIATQVVSRTRRVLGVDISLRQMFATPTVAGIAAAVEQRPEDFKLDINRDVAIVPVERDRNIPLSFAQERLWFLAQIGSAYAAYTVPLSLQLSGDLNVDVLRDCLQEVVRRHEVLRTTFSVHEGEAVQIVGESGDFKLETEDLSFMSASAREAAVDERIASLRSAPFDLERGPLFRASLLRISADWHILTLVQHHIVTDAWSLGILFRELSELYRAYSRGEASTLPELAIQYADYACWQRGWLQGEVLSSQLEFWRDQLTDCATLMLPADHARPPMQTFTGARVIRRLSAKMNASSEALGRRFGVTQFMVLLSAYATLMHRCSGQDDIVVGTPVAGRNHSEIEPVMGFFINSLPVRTRFRACDTFEHLLARVSEVCLGVFAHQDLPFEKMVEYLQPERDASRNPLFQVAFALQNATFSVPDLEGLELRPVPTSTETIRFDIECHVIPSANELVAQFTYNTDLFDASTIERMLSHYERILESVVSDPEIRIDDIDLLSARERAEQLEQWASTQTDYPRNATVAWLFSTQAEATPDAPALAYADRVLSYAELDAASNVVAQRLSAADLDVGAAVGVLLERSAEMVVSWLGVLKAGCAYVPLDADYPVTRLEYMVRDAGVSVVLSDAELPSRLPLEGLTFVDVTSLDGDAEPVEREIGALDAAYIVYTSGSTGEPKGVVVPHRAVVRLVRATDYLQLGPEDRVAQGSNASFDAATFEVWGSLLNGGCLVGVPREVLLDAGRYGAYLQESGVTALFMTTALFNQFSHVLPEAFSKMRAVLFGGEAVDVSAVRRVLAAGGPDRLLHVYGPTESTTFASWHEVAEVSSEALTVPIGKALANTQLYVLGARRELLPVGVEGELYIGGDGLALGYLNQAELTAEKFVASPFAEGERLYRTGDRVRWRSDGQLEFLGRIDGQVKLRGYRIELGEIEHALSAQDGVREALVLCREDTPGDKRLVGYVVSEQGVELQPEVSRSRLKERLPDYMLPSAFVVLDELPLTPNGKVDRAMLPVPEGERQTEQAYVAPRTELEARIAQICCELLEVQRVGIQDNFFDLGGHSLLLTRLRARLESELGVSLPMVKLFQHPTVDAVARYLDGERATASLHETARKRAAAMIGKEGQRSAAVAIVGMAGRFPQAGSEEAYWEALRNGEELIRFFTDEELAAAGVPETLRLSDNYVPARAVLDDVELFDAQFFGYPPREAELMDPQQRLFLESAYAALESAGIDPSSYAGLIGVYAGSSTDTYSSQVRSNPERAAAAGPMQLMISSAKDFLPTRVSYKLNLRGPSVNVQTACSTSLVALHMACRSLLEHECDVALAGGASIAVPRVGGYSYTEQGILSPDGHCRSFDARSEGTVAGEGVGVVVLKRLSEALADGDHIRAVIRGTAINNDGSDKVGFTAPGVGSQTEAIVMAQSVAGVEASSIGYVEAHGTATSLGDPIELEALNTAFGGRTEAGASCALGSVKSNMGHLDAAAGIAGLMKTVLMLEHGEIPPSLHYEEANPEIDFEAGPFYVNTQLKPWERVDGQPRRAGVSSFGMGGTNAHVVLEEAPELAASDASRRWQVLVVSAKNEAALAEACANLADHLEQHPDEALADVAYTLQVGRTGFERRVAVVSDDLSGAIEALRKPDAVRSAGEVRDGRAPEVVFLYPGQGTQYPNMGRELYEVEAVYREAVDECCERLAEALGLDLRTLLYPQVGDEEAAGEALKRTSLTQPALFVTEYALTQLLAEWGIRPVAMVGHSIGELVAACVSGVLDRDAALRLVTERGRLMEEAPSGVMVSVLASAEQARVYEGEGIWLSVVNGPQASVLSCTHEASTELEARLEADGLAYQRLQTSHAFHCGLMDNVLGPLDAVSEGLSLAKPQVAYVSNVTGDWVDGELDAGYWSRQVRAAVRFDAGVETVLARHPDAVLLEVGPGQALSQLVRGVSKDKVAAVVRTQAGAKDKGTAGEWLARGLGELWCAGVAVDWAKTVGAERRLKVALPTYPFQRKRYWVEPGKRTGVVAPALERNADIADWFYVPSWRRVGNLPEVGPGKVDDLAKNWLVFADSTGVAERLCARLNNAGHSVFLVRPGGRFEVLDDQSITLCPGEASHYESLLELVCGSDGEVQDIVHLWGVNGETGIESDELIERCFYSPLFLARALGRGADSTRGRLMLVTDEMQEVTSDEAVWPEKATIMGPCGVIPREYPELRCRSVDLQRVRTANDADAAYELLLQELLMPSPEPVIAYRNARRWLPDVVPVRIDLKAEETPARLRDDGVYLITGGLGGIGLALANYLFQAVEARLVLLSRRELPPRDQWDNWLSRNEDDETGRTLRAVCELEAAGAEVLVLSADVTDNPRMRAVVDEVEQRFGALHGVIHSAGLAGGGIIHLKTRELAAPVLAPKICGTRVLAEVLGDRPLDFMVLCSSMASMVSPLGQVDYTAANAYQDAFAQSARRRWQTPTISINWDTWSDVGMAVDTEQPDLLSNSRSKQLAFGLSSTDGQEAFRRVLASALQQVVVSPKNLVPRSERELPRTAPIPDKSAVSGKSSDPGEWFYAPSWRPSIVPVVESIEARPRRWLVLTEAGGLGASLAEGLEDGGAEVIRVLAGEGFECRNEKQYVVLPSSHADLDALLDHLAERQWRPDVVLHGFGLDDVSCGIVADPAQVDEGFFNVLHLLQAFNMRWMDQPWRLELMTHGVLDAPGGSPPIPARAAVAGLCRVILQELAVVACRLIDVGDDRRDGGLVDVLLTELRSPPSTLEVAYRGARRWVRGYDPIAVPASDNSTLLVDRGGVYLITGGLGRIGLALAKCLATEFKAKLVLTSRSSLPERASWDDSTASWRSDPLVSARVDAVRALEAAGAEVMIAHTDVTDEESMRATVVAAEERFGPITSIVHAAGVMSGSGVQGLLNLDRDACNTMFEPKLRGARVLESVLAGRPLDLCLLVSSLSTVLGGLSLGAYASANACLDALAAQDEEASGLPWSCVNWDGWRGVEEEVPQGSAAAHLTMSVSEGIETFRRIAAMRGVPRVVVSTANLEARLAQWVTISGADADTDKVGDEGLQADYERPDLAEEYVAPRSELEEKVAAIWGRLLGIDRVGVHDNFLDLGGHSLLATQMLARLRGDMNVNLTLEQVFLRPTVAELAEVISAQESTESRYGEMQELIQQVDELTPAEHQALLEQARRARGDK